jgi:transposase InsO family protein
MTEFEQQTLNTHWVGDITYIKTYQGWSYLASVYNLWFLLKKTGGLCINN